MNTTAHEYKTGWKRGLVETRISLTTPSDMLGYLVPLAIMVVVLAFMRGGSFEDAPVSLGSMSMPGIIGLNLAFGGMMTLVGALVMDRTNGTLLRAKSIPGGMTGYLVGRIVSTSMFLLLNTVVLLGVGLIVFDGLEFGSPDRWLLFVLVVAMGLISMLSIGAVLGSLVNQPQNMALVVMPFMGVVAISGIFYPIAALPEWLQAIGQVFPVYWLGLGMRHALLPDALSAVEIGDSWRTLEMFAVLAAWAVVSLAVAPRLLRRMSRRESGSSVAQRREKMQQGWG
ncbi:ABC transporter permease [Glycomyces arizonensis]|uniref:ABC transporter permease n=1 Tax=Glycomyces arizonensis TaxID=256035 RepID=UPI0004009D1E|nr:ABC transporter permease [Glycomyces arizonensis]